MSPSDRSGVRASLRQAARSLPAPAQLWLKRVDAAVLGTDIVEPIRQLRLRESALIDETIARARHLPGRRRILMLTLQTPSPWSETEGGLAMALALRGHDVRGILCDGLLPVCEMNLGPHDRPDCAVCVGWRARTYEGAFGFAWPRLSRHLSDGDVEEAGAIVDRTSAADRRRLMVDGVPVGRFARRELQRYYRGFVDDPSVDPAYRPWLVSGVLMVRLLSRVLEAERPDLVVASSGRTLASASLVALARARRLRVVTWDTEASHPDGLVFSHDRPAVEVVMDEAWATAKSQPLSSAQQDELRAYLGRWSRSETTPFPYNTEPMDDAAEIAARLGLREGAPLIVAFANASWDMAVVDRDAGFSNAFDWLLALVDHARRRPDIDLVIRAHPAETNVPDDLKSRTPVPAEIRRRADPLPSNVYLVAGDDPTSSYTLARMARVVTVYSTRFGLEIALDGRRPWVAGDVTYRGKGFTRDLSSREDLHRLLDANAYDERLTPDEQALAERFAYLWFFRHVTRIPRLRPADGRFHLDSFGQLAPGGDAEIDRLCEAMVSGQPFVSLERGGAAP